VRELVLTDAGVNLADAYAIGGEVLMGTLRWEKENERRREKDDAHRHGEVRQKAAEHALAETRARMEALVGEQALREAELARILAERKHAREVRASEGTELAHRRGGDAAPTRRAATRRAAARS
jgi:circadian clock protein KaiC